MKEKFNNRVYIYTYLQFFYKYADDELLKDVLENLLNSILENILFNVSLQDLNQLIKHRKEWENLKAKNKEKYTLKELNNSYKIKMNIKDITNQNTKKFLKSKDLYNTLSDAIFILF